MASKPNVLFLICDDLNCDIACYGNQVVKTPHMDALAARGVRFDRAYCQYPLCGPSRASFMTGMYPDQTAITRNGIFLRQTLPKVVSMSEQFRNAGYHATRIGKIYHYNVPLHIGTGGHDDPYSWDKTINPEGHDTAIHDKIFTLVPGRFGGTMSWYADDAPAEEQTDGIAATEADRVLETYAKNKTPFFLAVGLYRPHTPYVAPKKYFDLYPPSSVQVPKVPDGYLDTLPKPCAKVLQVKKDQLNLPNEIAQQAIAAYHASITFADDQIGRILDSLDRHGLSENTIVVFTSDHGYHMGEHGWYQKQTLFENGTRVPLIFAGPNISSGATASSPAEMTDICQTLCSLANIDAPETATGLDLSPALADPKTIVRRDALSQLLSGYALRTERFRLVSWGEDGRDGFELYDHENDPEEMVNLANDPEQQKLLEQLKSRLAKRIQQARTISPALKKARGVKRKPKASSR